MHVLFVAPHFPQGQRRFVQALTSVGARVTGIGEMPAEHLDDSLKRELYGWEQVHSVCDPQALLDAVQRVQKREWVDRLEATIESHVLTTAKVREAATIPGTSVKSAILCTDKAQMKAYLREKGVPCAAASMGTLDEIRQFIQRVGYPVVLKPIAAAGASGTWAVSNDEQLARAVQDLGVERGNRVAIEEFVEGHEGFYDTLTVNGQVAHEFVSHYYPNVLEAMRTRWISPQIVVTNRIDAHGYNEVKQLGRRVVGLLGLETSASHMEWFFGPKGLRFSEIGARPPGVSHWDLYSAANEFDLYREWAHALVHGRVDRQPSRRYSAGIIALRPERDGWIQGYEGIDILQKSLGEWVVDCHLPSAGTPTQPIEGGYMANAWVRLRHPDYDTLREMLDTVGRTLKVRAG